MSAWVAPCDASFEASCGPPWADLAPLARLDPAEGPGLLDFLATT
jgi:hypothetical protein